MSDVMFDEERYTPSRASASTNSAAQAGSIIGLMYKLGIAKTRNDANIIMGGLILVCIIVSATMLVFVQPHADPSQAALIQQDLARMQAQQSQQTQAQPAQSSSQ